MPDRWITDPMRVRQSARPVDEWEDDDPIGQLLALIEGPEWMTRANCRKPDVDQGIFFPTRGEMSASNDAKEVCRFCPVKRECLELALSFGHVDGPEGRVDGVWAGTSRKERQRIARERAGMPARLPRRARYEPVEHTYQQTGDGGEPVSLGQRTHGRVATYNVGCRCAKCTRAAAEKRVEYRAKAKRKLAS